MSQETSRALDPLAPSIVAEYVRYLDFDVFGKILTKNFLVNRLGYAESAIHIPIGRYGDTTTKYGSGGFVQDLADGYLDTEQGRIVIEVKCARINIANRSAGGSEYNWGFTSLLHSPGKAEKEYDILIAIGVQTLGLEDDRYWEHLEWIHTHPPSMGTRSDVNAWPHETAYLNLCSFFVIPRACVKNNYFRVMLQRLDTCRYATYQAWGYDENKCRAVWNHALDAFVGAKLGK